MIDCDKGHEAYLYDKLPSNATTARCLHLIVSFSTHICFGEVDN